MLIISYLSIYLSININIYQILFFFVTHFYLSHSAHFCLFWSFDWYNTFNTINQSIDCICLYLSINRLINRPTCIHITLSFLPSIDLSVYPSPSKSTYHYISFYRSLSLSPSLSPSFFLSLSLSLYIYIYINLIYNSVGVEKKTDCTICKFYKLISGKKFSKKETTKNTRATWK